MPCGTGAERASDAANEKKEDKYLHLGFFDYKAMPKPVLFQKEEFICHSVSKNNNFSVGFDPLARFSNKAGNE
jgi:hypothetical protein